MSKNRKNRPNDGNEAIQVAIRASRREKAESASEVVTVFQETREIVVPERVGSEFTRTYGFNSVFPPKCRQFELYQEVVCPIVEDVLAGYNCTIFAYGQTGTGKTFSMEGDPQAGGVGFAWHEDPQSGIIPRALAQIIDELGVQDQDHTVTVSFLQLYNEEIYDLLCDAVDLRDMQKLKLYDDPNKKGSVRVDKLTEEAITTKAQVQDILARGRARRVTAATRLNDASSRSHTVFSITVQLTETYELDDGSTEQITRIGKLNLVDLAGSESVGRSGAVETRAREAGQINQSLLALGRVIGALVECASHVPYRESKLTRILQDSLGGTSKSYIIATISPSSTCLEETQRTLDFALRAKNIMNRPEITQIRKEVVPLPIAPAAGDSAPFLEELPPKPSILLTGPDDSETIPALIAWYEKRAELRKNHVADTQRYYHKICETLPLLKGEISNVVMRNRALETSNRGLTHQNSDLRRQLSVLQMRFTQVEAEQRLIASQEEEFRRREGLLSHQLLARDQRFQQLREVVLPNYGGTGAHNAPSDKGRLGKQFASTPVLAAQGRAGTMPPPKTPKGAAGQPGRSKLYPSLENLPGSARRVRAPSPPAKPSSRPVVNPRNHRRSRSAGGTVIDHMTGDKVPTGTYFKSTIPGRKAIRDIKTGDLKKASDYVVSHQKVDPETGLVGTRLYKGGVYPTAGGGTAVVFDDVESLRQRTPTSSSVRKRNSDDEVDASGKKARKSK